MIKKALFLSSISNFILRIIGFIGVVSYARLLSPSELGVFVIASSVMIMASEFTVLGTNTFIIREKNISVIQLKSCLGLAVCIAWGLGLLFIILSFPISKYYELPDLKYLISILSISFFLVPFTSTTSALFSKEFKYSKIVTMQLLGGITNLSISILLIYADLSYFALAIGQISGVLVEFITAYLIKPRTTTWKFHFIELRPIAKVGIFSSLINSLAKLEVLLPDIIIGKTSTPEKVALVSRAVGMHGFLRDLLSSSIVNIALPFLSSSKDERELKSNFLKATTLTTVFIAPPIAVAGVMAEPLIFTLFGNQWGKSVEIAQILAIWMALKTMLFMINPALLAAKEEQNLLYYRSLGVFILAIAIIVNEMYIQQNIAYSFITAALFQIVSLYYLVIKKLKISISSIAKSLLSSTITTMGCAGVAYFLKYLLFGSISYYMQLLAIGLLLVPVWYLFLRITHNPLYIHIVEMNLNKRLCSLIPLTKKNK